MPSSFDTKTAVICEFGWRLVIFLSEINYCKCISYNRLTQTVTKWNPNASPWNQIRMMRKCGCFMGKTFATNGQRCVFTKRVDHIAAKPSECEGRLTDNCQNSLWLCDGKNRISFLTSIFGWKKRGRFHGSTLHNKFFIIIVHFELKETRIQFRSSLHLYW